MKLDKNTLSDLVRQGLSQHNIATILNSNQSTIRRYLIKYQLRTIQTGRSATRICKTCTRTFHAHGSHQKFCSIKCQHELQYQDFIEDWLSGVKNGSGKDFNISNHIRRWLQEQRGEKCWLCAWDKKHLSDGKCPLEIDHIDGDHTNNKPENLRLLCPNCHSLTLTYRGRNRGNGRHARRERYHSGKSY
jgi:hypothetical protein